MKTTPRIGIIGGGMMGLAMAHRLAGTGARVTVIEAAAEPGGLAAPWTIGDVTWDRHYHVILASDRTLRRLLAEVGLDGTIRWGTTRTGVFGGGRLHSMSNTLEYLSFPLLSPLDKARLGLTILAADRIHDGLAMEQVPVEDWLVRWSGRRTWERFWLPLLRSKLGENWKRTSAAFIWATIRRLHAARDAGLERERFGYVPGGYARILRRLAEALAREGVQMRLSCPVRRVSSAGGRPKVHFPDGRTESFDTVVVTLAAPLAARLLPDLPPEPARRMAEVPYQGIVCASLLLRRPLSGFYVTNLLDPFPFTGIIEMTALVPPEEMGGRHLVYLPRYVPSDDPFLRVPDDAVRREFLQGLRQVHPDLREDDVEAFRVSRVSHVMAIPTLGASSRLPPIRTPLPGVYAAGSAHIVHGTLNVEETVRLAERVARALPHPDAFGDDGLPREPRSSPPGQGDPP
ncbi:NAD(P)/FAD-dependent oxidoreductase [Myxococcota bacterium]|nr:NAD(P)/FAD-dependent oxidoreductase [Myxococcota bacterium]